MKYKNKNLGFSLIEIIVALGIFAILAAGVFYVAGNSFSNFYGSGDKQQITQFTQEAIEVVKSIRDNSWQDIENVVGTGDKGLAKNVGGYWEFSGTSNTLGDLTRVVGVSSIYRDSSGNIVDSGGTIDPNTYKVTATTTASGIDPYVLNTILTNWAYKSWSQSDWSGVGAREFWSNNTMASSSYSNVNTTTVGELKLSFSAGTPMSWSAWVDFSPDEVINNQAWEDFYNFYLGPDGKSLYSIGTSNWGFVKYDISKAQAGILRPEWKITLPWHIQSMALHPSNNYAYVAKRLPADGTNTICVANLTALTITTGTDCYGLTYAGATWYIMTMAVNADGDRLYIFDNYGYAYTFAITGSGATLSLLNPRQTISSVAGTSYSINQVYLDESGAIPYVYIVSDDNSGEFRKMGIDEPSGWYSSTSTYAYVSSTPVVDFTDIEYLETSSGNKRFVLASEDSAAEFMIVEDNSGTSLRNIGSYNLSTSQANAEVTSDRENMAFISYYSPNGLYAVDITNRASLASGSFTNTAFTRKSNYTTYDQALYSTTSRGLFFPDHNGTTNTTSIYFIGKAFTRATGGSYDYKRAITLGLDSTVSSGPHADFPVVISESQTYLKTTGNGGRVYNEDGYDIIFTLDSDGNTVLDHEIEYYNGTTGELTAWVKVPSLASNTTIYMFYGNDQIISTQEHVDGVWSNGYQLVNHMADSGIGGVTDSVIGSNGFFKYGVSAPTEAYGKIGRSQSFDGTYDYLTLENTQDKNQSNSDFTVEFWMKPSSAGARAYSAPVYFGNGDSNVNDGWLFRHYTSTTKKLYFHMGDGTTNLGGMYLSASAITDNVWTHVAMTVDRNIGYQSYLNSVATASCTVALTCTSDSSAKYVGEVYSVNVGKDWSGTDYFFTGEVDEFRISLDLKSQAWLTTGYNNMNSTSTFYSIGTESNAGGYNSPGHIYSSIFDLGSTAKELRNIIVEQNLPSGCEISIDLEADTEATFTDPTIEIFRDSSNGYYVSSTPATLNGKRYIRYKATLTACNSNADTPTLYSVKFNYR